ncbi:MAG: hypothetical protein QOI02_578, partial [Actinomycetota bacterium]|nr:hypothetical protein [Actinomycetota bacterium]
GCRVPGAGCRVPGAGSLEARGAGNLRHTGSGLGRTARRLAGGWVARDLSALVFLFGANMPGRPCTVVPGGNMCGGKRAAVVVADGGGRSPWRHDAQSRAAPRDSPALANHALGITPYTSGPRHRAQGTALKAPRPRASHPELRAPRITPEHHALGITPWHHALGITREGITPSARSHRARPRRPRAHRARPRGPQQVRFAILARCGPRRTSWRIRHARAGQR